MIKNIFPPCRDPSLPHLKCQDHLQQPERLRGGDGCPCWQWSWDGGGRTEGHPEDRHSITGKWLLQRLQLQLYQWEHTHHSVHATVFAVLQCHFLTSYSADTMTLIYIYCRTWAIFCFTNRGYICTTELWAVFITARLCSLWCLWDYGLLSSSYHLIRILTGHV